MKNNNSWKHQFVKPEHLEAHLKAGGVKTIGQLVKFKDQPTVSRFYAEEVNEYGHEVHIHLHGENANKRVNECFRADRKKVVLPHEPQQFRKMAKNIPSDKLSAIAGIAMAQVKRNNNAKPANSFA
jgi:hypothetical protein